MGKPWGEAVEYDACMKYFESGWSFKQIAASYVRGGKAMDHRTVRAWCKHYRDRGCTPAQKRRLSASRNTWDADHVDKLKAIVRASPHLFLDEIADELEAALPGVRRFTKLMDASRSLQR